MQLTALLSAQTCCTWSRFWKLLIIRHGNWRKRAGKRKVRKSGTIYLKLGDGSLCCNSLGESTKTRWSYVIYWTDDTNSGGSDTERPQCVWMQMIIPRTGTFAVNNDGLNLQQSNCPPNNCWYVCTVSVNGVSTILVSSFRESKSCKVTSIERGDIGWL